MVGIGSVLQFQYPTSKPGIDWRVENAGVDDAIVFWNTGLLGVQPTVPQLLTIQVSAPYVTWLSAPMVAQRQVEKDNSTVGRTNVVRKGADQAFTTVVFADCTSLQFPLLPNLHYQFAFKGMYTTAVNTTGLQLSVNGPALPVFMRAFGEIYTTTIAPFVGGIATYDAPVAATASSGATALPFRVEGTISTGAVGGTLWLRVRSEIAASAVTILRGSWGELSASV